MSYILGIDPGGEGATALLEDGKLLNAWDMPVVDGFVSESLYYDQLDTMLHMFNITKEDITGTAVEKVGANRVAGRPQGGSTMFKFGFNTGVVRGALASFIKPAEHPTPQQWKKHFGLIGHDKDRARLRAIELWPELSSILFNYKKNVGRADAALIARWYFDTKIGGPSPEKRKVRLVRSTTIDSHGFVRDDQLRRSG